MHFADLMYGNVHLDCVMSTLDEDNYIIASTLKMIGKSTTFVLQL